MLVGTMDHLLANVGLGCPTRYVAGALLMTLILAAVALDLGGFARLVHRFYSMVPGGHQSIGFYRAFAAVMSVLGLVFIVVLGPHIPCR
jgi:hypothetical protein